MIKILVAALFVLNIFLTCPAQTRESVCLEQQPAADASDPVVLNICNHTHGMAATPQPRLYFRLHQSGLVEYEVNPGYREGAGDANFVLLKKKIKVRAEDVAEVIRLCEQQDFQGARNEYPAFQIWTDSSLQTTIVFTHNGREKKIVVNNYSETDQRNSSYYPASLIALLKKIEELRKSMLEYN